MNFLVLGIAGVAGWWFLFRKSPLLESVSEKVASENDGTVAVPGTTTETTDGDTGTQGGTGSGVSGGGSTEGAANVYAPPFYPGQILTFQANPGAISGGVAMETLSLKIMSVGTGPIVTVTMTQTGIVKFPVGTTYTWFHIPTRKFTVLEGGLVNSVPL